MQYLNMKLPEGNMSISKIALGAADFGSSVSQEMSFRLMDSFADAGGNCIDTARVYAAWLPDGEGLSEQTIGKWLKSRGIRNKIILSTKGGHPPLGKMDCGRLSRKDIESDVDESLKALGVDTIDMYWLHRDDLSLPVEDIVKSLEEVIAKGKLRAVGCSNWRAERIAAANRFARQKGMAPFYASQIRWSLARYTGSEYDDPTIVGMDAHEYAWYRKMEFPVFAFSSQAGGFFTRVAKRGMDDANQQAYARYCTPENMARLERVKGYAAQKGLTPTAVALGALICNKVPTVAITGCKNGEQLADTLTAADVDLSEDTADWLFEGKTCFGN